MTVHIPRDPDKGVSVTTAAALAESARKLAQEAACFIDKEEEKVALCAFNGLAHASDGVGWSGVRG